MTKLTDFAGYAPLLDHIAAQPPGRLIIAIAGPPGAGKSAFAQALADCLNSNTRDAAAIVPVDSFHYDDHLLEALGLRSRKGSPPTFDFGGLRHLLKRLRANDEPKSQSLRSIVVSKFRERARASYPRGCNSSS